MNDVTVECGRPTMVVTEDADPEPSYLEQEGFEKRLVDYREGRFGYVGVSARAVLRFHHRNSGGYYTEQIVESPGCWGIEDDAGEEFMESIFHEELVELASILRALGVQMPQPQ